MKIRLELEGVKEAIANLKRIEVKAEAESKRSMAMGAQVLKADVVSRMPTDQGDMARGVEVRSIPDGGEVESTALHTIHVEYGTSEQKAQPSLRPAMDESGPRIIENAARQTWRAIDG